MDLKQYGWNEFYEKKYIEIGYNNEPVGRITAVYNDIYEVITKEGEINAKLKGKAYKVLKENCTKPAVGDWVILQTAENNRFIVDILPRKSKLSRKTAGNEFSEQVIAANIDTIFIVTSLNNDFNLRRLERYITTAWDSGATPVIVLSKADLCDNVEDKIKEVNDIAPGINIYSISAVNEQGIKNLTSYIKEGHTIALIGSSGVGKSTLVNTLAKEELLKVSDIREGDGRGKHTTTYRQLVLLREGGMIIDTPGMRELALLDSRNGIMYTFSDIIELSKLCKFNDCRHKSEPGCAVKKAISEGIITEERLESFNKLSKEIEFNDRKQAKKVNIEKKRINKFKKR